jgi:hypothetical protein
VIRKQRSVSEIQLDLTVVQKHRFNGSKSINREARSSTLSSKRQSISARTEKQFASECRPQMIESQGGIDVNLQACMRNFYNVERQAEKDFGHRIVDNRSLVRSLNIAMNSMIKVPEGVFKNIIVLNISMNRLKSLYGLEECSRL